MTADGTHGGKRAGRPRTGIGPEYQEVLRLYEHERLAPAAIAARLGKTRAWANSAVQWLRAQGVITRHNGRPVPAPTAQVVITLDAEDIAGIERDIEETRLRLSAEDPETLRGRIVEIVTDALGIDEAQVVVRSEVGRRERSQR